ncbi:MAG: hypothetical protein LBT46_00335 [Planctomycetaceae bacterium]|jgi:hypothetical protein|nr:hypothetical protein [Planctomycetaceae bacterium]
MSEFFQIRCPACGVKLNAKFRHIGKTKNCPKCGADVFVPEPPNSLESGGLQGAGAEGVAAASASLPNESISLRPAQLEFHDRYFILGKDRIVAVWQGGEGWKVNVGSGFAPARSNQTAIPDNGVFAFVHLVCTDGIPSALEIHRISSRGALMAIVRDENAVLNRLEEKTELSPEQKDVLMRYMRQIYMVDVLDQAKDVLDSLSIIEANSV